MRISGEVNVSEIDAWEVQYRGVALQLILEEVLEKLKLKITIDGYGRFSVVDREHDDET